ncbi:conserved Plasmodium protein, unknown function [Plasmodium knowlesi strain H]|uniref:Uncharacterized protein n=3 Tax=Plasmodium knowlesi TaxID=5850 RepID=A0A5K1TUR0_PLAKH|nr:conserved Plasmodium protein, unknown function [Plasmodium knowlesi strain H]OTN67937.1 Uncharacterized protein PKNOH_S04342700 [Plasmodium knowlesi]CAA9990260.1 conserved Plasmodium protein, unknown function [Plasmodium knowlesi strain H]SBO26779.1 conserved Plasmodium protein, unknown function [Plasmodium knowlesi strain H]SBO28419.1 conserved Plasmodium protein, unknown function [Plasmodium knowlesi strain H]VVS79734.1 conserved Plasmodium protein, unknown function [Plasmodium knowlesi s|eukprot:XP_002258041.1 hypothetical protein, conserved in Plasmodium species [Plasmodium knowlesi strain H]
MATYNITRWGRRYRFIHNARQVQIIRKGQVKFLNRATQNGAKHYVVEGNNLPPLTINNINFVAHADDSALQVELPNDEDKRSGENTSSPKCNSVGMNEHLTIDKEETDIMVHIINHLETCKKTSRSYLDFLTLSTLHKQEIEKKQKNFYCNDKIRDHLREYIQFAVKNKHYPYLFNIYEMICLYKIDDVELIRELVQYILIYTTNEEEKVIHSYWIVKNLAEKKKHDKVIAMLVIKYLFNDSFFNFLQRNACISSNFVNLLSYVSDSIGSYPNESILCSLHSMLRKYALHFNSRLEKEIEPKILNNLEELAKLQEIFLKNGFYDDDFNLLIKRLVLTCTSYVNPFDLLVLSSNVLLNFSTNDHLFLCPKEQQGRATPMEGIPLNGDNPTKLGTLSRRYRNFLSAKTMIDVVIRTNDPYMANTCNDLEYIQRYLLLCSYCHFTLFSNWWADTVICDRLKKKKKPHKTVLRSRMPYRSHLVDQVSHLLDVILQSYESSGKGGIDPYACVGSVRSERGCNPPGDTISRYLPYLFKSFIRMAINKSEMIHNNSYILFFEQVFLHIVDEFVAKYEQRKVENHVDANDQGSLTNNARVKVMTREYTPHYAFNPGDNINRDESNPLPSDTPRPLYTDELSLYDISSICECFFLVKLMQGSIFSKRRMVARKGVSILHAPSNERENHSNSPLNRSRDAFEKTLYLFLERLTPSSEIHPNSEGFITLDKQDILKQLINKIRSSAEPVFLYYLMLRTILPILFSDTREECLDVTKTTISCILSLPFRADTFVNGLSSAQGDDSTHKNFYHILKKLTQWENCVISINSQRRIRIQTKRRGLPYDFFYAGDFLRPSSIFLLCLNEITKWEDVYLPFLQEVFISDNFSEGDKANFSDLIQGARDSVDFSISRFLRERRA